jgi:GntR family transcriptional regulator/MocR family aminotransferase
MTSPLSTAGTTDAAALALSVDRRSAEPIGAQIGRQLRQMILSGRMPRGAQLPSSRALADDLGVSRATVVTAYDQLASEGYVEGRHGAGMFVSSALPEQVLQVSTATPHRPATPKRTTTRVQTTIRPFQVGAIDPELFPFREWSRLLQRTWRSPRKELLAHQSPFGWPELRQAIARHLLEWRGIACDDSRIVITSGTTDAIELITHLAFAPGTRVLVEDPGYPSLRYMLQRLGIGTDPVPVDAEGFDLSAAALTDGVRGAIVTPSRQFPLGPTLPLARRLALLDWANTVDGTIVEDDFDSEYRYEGTPLPALASLDTGGRSIYVGSFSKVLLPTLRLGFVVLPDHLVAPAQKHLLQRGAMASLVAQPALAEFMQTGAYATHIRRTRRVYARRMNALMAEQQRFGRLLTLMPTMAGMHVVADIGPGLARKYSDSEIAKIAAEAGLRVAPLADYYVGSPTRRGLLLGFAGFPEAQLTAGARKLAAALATMTR